MAAGSRKPPIPSTEQAFRGYLQQQFVQLQSHEEVLFDPPHPEALHDFRVAMRRIRTALELAKEHDAGKSGKTFRKDFARLGRLTGPARDLEVFLRELPGHQQSIDRDPRFSLEAVTEVLAKRFRREQKRILRVLTSPDYLRLKTNWGIWLEDPESLTLPARLPEPPLDARLAKFMTDGSQALSEASPEALHELRKDAKKLRYLLEISTLAHPDVKRSRFVRALKNLQDCLGIIQDRTVQVELVRRVASKLFRRRKIDPGTLLAAGLLIGRLQEEQQQALRSFPKYFADFSCQAGPHLQHATSSDNPGPAHGN